MAAPEVRVKLSAEGVQEVVNAFRKVSTEAGKAGAKTSASMKEASRSTMSLSSALQAIGIGAAVAGLARMAKGAIDTADAVGDLSAATGVTTEMLSVLTYQANKLGVGSEALKKALVVMGDTLTSAKTKGGAAAEALGKLGVSMKDIKTLSPDAILQKIIGRMGELKGSFDKVSLAKDVFGKGGVDLIEVLDSLANQGFANVVEEAKKAGLIISTDFANAAGAAKDAVAALEAQVQGMTTQFLTGFLPAVSNAAEAMSKHLAGPGAGFEKLGKLAGKVLSGITYAFLALGKYIGHTGAAIGHFWDMLKRGDIKGLLAPDDEFRKALRANLMQELADVYRDVYLSKPGDVIPSPPAGAGKRSLPPGGPKTPVLGAASIAAGFMPGTLAGDLEEAAKALANLQKESEDYIDGMIAWWKAQDEEAKKLKTDLDEIAARKQDEAFRSQIEGAFGQLDIMDREAANIAAQVAQGKLFEFQADQMIYDLEQQRLPLLRQIAEALQQAAITPEQIKAAQDYAYAVEMIGQRASQGQQFMADFKRTAFDAMVNGLGNLLTLNQSQWESWGSAVRGILSSIVNSIQQMLAQMLAAKLIGGLFSLFAGGGGAGAFGIFGGGGDKPVRAAEGGYISGPGTGTSDSIPAMLSNGEYVVPALAVAAPGNLAVLEAMRAASRSVSSSRPYHYAGGGMVSGPAPSAASFDGNLTVGLEDGLVVRNLETPAGSRAIVNVISKNQRAIRQALGV